MRTNLWRLLMVPLLAIAVHATSSAAVSEADAAAIKATALNYVEGWYEGNAQRMESALHPDLAKRIVVTKEGKSMLRSIGAADLVAGTARGGGKNTPVDKQQRDVQILDVFENAASVRATMGGWIDYMHMARFDGRWVIVNVLWEYKPQPKQQ